MLIPYIVFYLLSLFLVRLRRPISRDQIRPSPQRQAQQNPYRQYPLEAGRYPSQQRPQQRAPAPPPSRNGVPPRYSQQQRRPESRDDIGKTRIL